MASLLNVKYKLSNSFHALTHRNFRYFWMGQCVSLIGTWMQNIALPWVAYSITKSPFLLGLASAAQFAPMLFFSLFAGVLIDRFPKKRIIILTQSTAMVLAFILAFLVWTGHIQYWHILLISLGLGFVNTIDMPARQSFMIELVGREDLMNAIALNSSIFNAARIVGPAVAGLLMSYFGAAFCFLINALSYIAVIYGLSRIDAKPRLSTSAVKHSVFGDIKEGITYISGSKALYSTLLLTTVVNIFAMNMSVVIPVFVTNVLHLKETGFGLIMSTMGVGSFVGAVTLAARSKSGPRSFILYGSASLISLMLIAGALVPGYYLLAAAMMIFGFSATSFFSTANSTLQLNSSDELRGRVISVYTLAFGGTTPIGNLIAGTLTDKFGPQAAFIFGGAVILVFVCLFLCVVKVGRREK